MTRAHSRGMRHSVLRNVLGCLMLLGVASWASADHSGVDGNPVVDAAVPAYEPAAGVSGALTIAGSDTMQPLMSRLASEFRRSYPNTTIAVQGGGSDSAMETFLQGVGPLRRGDGNYRGPVVGSNRTMILASSRPLTAHEREEARSAHGHEPLEIPIALDAVAIYVHRDNPLQGLSLEQVDAMFGKDRKRGLGEGMTTWGQVGLEGWEQQPIHLYGRDKKSGTRTFFRNVALLDGELRPDVREEPGSASEILAISRDPSGIGYAGIGFQASTVRVVPLAEKAGMPYVKPSADSVGNGTYPLGRFLYLYVKKDPKAPLQPHILEFLKFINSREGQKAVAKAGAYPLPTPQVAKNLQLLTGSPMSAGLGTASSN